MSAKRIWLVPILTLSALGTTPGQVKVLPKKTPPKQKLELEILKSIRWQPVRFNIQPHKIVMRPRLQAGPWRGLVSARKPNRLMTADYAAALSSYDRTRAKLTKCVDAKSARKLLDELDRELLKVRKALFELEKAANARKKAGLVTIRSSTGLLLNRSQIWTSPLMFKPTLVPLKVQLRLGNQLISSKPTNELLVGDYRTATDELNRSRAQLTEISNAKAARMVVDKMTRQILDARRALWELERAKK